jgi:hypothetical protein
MITRRQLAVLLPRSRIHQGTVHNGTHEDAGHCISACLAVWLPQERKPRLKPPCDGCEICAGLL